MSGEASLQPGSEARVSLVGLGNLGVPIAERVLGAGYPLTVFNRTAGKAAALVEQGARQAERLDSLLDESDVCVTVVSDDAALEEVATEVLSHARPGTVLVDMSTVSVAASKRVADAAAGAGVHFLRAPVSGNPVVVRSGNLTVIVSGPEEGFELAREVIYAIGPNVYLVGEAEQARVVKLALQIMIAGTAELMAEALLLGEAGGVDPAKLLEVMGGSAAGSPFVKYKTEPLLRGDYSATFTTSMMRKDVGLVLAVAEDAGLALPLTDELRHALDDTIESGYGELDLMALLLRLQEKRSGAASASTPTPPA